MILKQNKPFLITTIVLAFIALVSAVQLTLEKIELWKNPDYVPSCSWNPLFSCQGPMQSWQSSVFVLPNPIIGIVGFSVVIVLAGTALFVQFPKWYWAVYLGGISAATVFIIWLITQSLYDIQALCIYCMVVWAMMIPLFWLTLTEFVRAFGKPDSKKVQRFIQLKWVFIIVSYLAVILMIYTQFTSALNFIIQQMFS